MNEEEQKKQLAIRIADLIQRLLRDSDELADLLDKAHAEGYDILLSVFSGVVIRRSNASSEEINADSEETEILPLQFEFTDADRDFLQSIGIQVTE